jgi:hypothetical protein
MVEAGKFAIRASVAFIPFLSLILAGTCLDKMNTGSVQAGDCYGATSFFRMCSGLHPDQFIDGPNNSVSINRFSNYGRTEKIAHASDCGVQLLLAAVPALMSEIRVFEGGLISLHEATLGKRYVAFIGRKKDCLHDDCVRNEFVWRYRIYPFGFEECVQGIKHVPFVSGNAAFEGPFADKSLSGNDSKVPNESMDVVPVSVPSRLRKQFVTGDLPNLTSLRIPNFVDLTAVGANFRVGSDKHRIGSSDGNYRSRTNGTNSR